MKLATLRDRTRDGMLVVVSRDLTRCVSARPIAATLQQALDDWAHVAPRLADLAHDLELGALPSQRFHEHDALSPLPRAVQWLDASAYIAHSEAMRAARGTPMPDTLQSIPPMRQAVSDGYLAPRSPIPFTDADLGLDFEAEVAVVTGDVPMGATAEEAASAIRMVMLVNDVTLRALAPAEFAGGFGPLQSKPTAAFSPVAVTPDELGDAFDGGRVHLPLLVTFADRPFGRANAGADMTFDFPSLIAHAARTRSLGAGTIVAGGAVSNRGPDGRHGRTVAEGGAGFSCLAELRAVEIASTGSASTPFMIEGDVVRIEMRDAAGHSVFGAIEQRVEAPSADGSGADVD